MQKFQILQVTKSQLHDTIISFHFLSIFLTFSFHFLSMLVFIACIKERHITPPLPTANGYWWQASYPAGSEGRFFDYRKAGLLGRRAAEEGEKSGIMLRITIFWTPISKSKEESDEHIESGVAVTFSSVFRPSRFVCTNMSSKHVDNLLLWLGNMPPTTANLIFMRFFRFCISY